MAEEKKEKTQAFNLSPNVGPQSHSKLLDDDGRIKRRGTNWTASAHIITAVIGSGVLLLAWATAQLGWIAGPIVVLLFAFVTYYTSALLADCYRSGDPVSGKSGIQVKICGIIQDINLVWVAIGYTIAASISMMAIKRSNCFHDKGDKRPCHILANSYKILFRVAEIIFSLIPDFDQIWWLSYLAALMFF